MKAEQGQAAAFDGIAAQYDDIFTRSLIGRAQRQAVWEIVRRHFQAGQSVLELNCGTGEDALFLASLGMKVLATDISPAMIEVAQRRLAAEPLKAGVEFRVSAIENLGKFSGKEKFDAVFSNFSGLNCVSNLAAVACDLARMTRPRAKAVFCLTNRYCVWETLWYALHGQLGRAFRRLHHNGVIARIGDGHIHVHYPSLSQITGAFAPYFSVTEIRGIGIAVPPSYLEPWARRMPAWISTGARVDRFLSRFPLLRAMGDHVAVVLERRAA